MDTAHKKLKVGRERGGHLSTTISYPSKNLISLPSHRTGVKLFEIKTLFLKCGGPGDNEEGCTTPERQKHQKCWAQVSPSPSRAENQPQSRSGDGTHISVRIW